jgi:hypothetical protein
MVKKNKKEIESDEDDSIEVYSSSDSDDERKLVAKQTPDQVRLEHAQKVLEEIE